MIELGWQARARLTDMIKTKPQFSHIHKFPVLLNFNARPGEVELCLVCQGKHRTKNKAWSGVRHLKTLNLPVVVHLKEHITWLQE